MSLKIGITGASGVLGSELQKKIKKNLITFKGDLTKKKDVYDWIKNNIFKVIEVELQIGKLYKNENKNFLDLEKHLVNNNYRLFSIDRFGNLMQDPTLEFNLIYVCKNDFDL